jgi:hypothetical protein
MLGPLGCAIGFANDEAVVEIVRVEFVVPEFGVTLDGEKEQEVSAGNPEHASVTEFVNAPNCEPTDSV